MLDDPLVGLDFRGFQLCMAVTMKNVLGVYDAV
jgi:hypothetical protein